MNLALFDTDDLVPTFGRRGQRWAGEMHKTHAKRFQVNHTESEEIGGHTTWQTRKKKPGRGNSMS